MAAGQAEIARTINGCVRAAVKRQEVAGERARLITLRVWAMLYSMVTAVIEQCDFGRRIVYRTLCEKLCGMFS